MSYIDALILGLIQGLTEFLPVSSSGHLEIGKVLLGVSMKENITFTIVVHGATVCSTIVVFYKEIGNLFKGLFDFKWNESTAYIMKLLVSCIPVLLVALFFEKKVEELFTGNIILVGIMLLFTALLLGFTYFAKPKNNRITLTHSLIPGISRSGATISSGLLLGDNREEVARFSFLMVLIPIIGKNLLDLFSGTLTKDPSQIMPLIIGFISAFISGWIACKLMINIVKRSKLIYFAAYCFLVGILALILS